VYRVTLKDSEDEKKNVLVRINGEGFENFPFLTISKEPKKSSTETLNLKFYFKQTNMDMDLTSIHFLTMEAFMNSLKEMF
jgi:hypothetical protein